jgi:hypothetical protein
MADAALFIGWGPVVRGREAKALAVFGEAIAYYGRLAEEGRVEDFETVLLDPHGGDLAGFVLLRGSSEQLAAVQADAEFDRLTVRAQFIVDNIGIVRARIGDGIGQILGVIQEQIPELAS